MKKQDQMNLDLWQREKTIIVQSNPHFATAQNHEKAIQDHKKAIQDHKKAIQDHIKSLNAIHGREMRQEKHKAVILSL